MWCNRRYSFKEESFDIVLSSLAFHYIKDYKELIEDK